VIDEEWYIYNNGERVSGLPLDMDLHYITWNLTDSGHVNFKMIVEEQYLWNLDAFDYDCGTFTENTAIAFIQLPFPYDPTDQEFLQ